MGALEGARVAVPEVLRRAEAGTGSGRHPAADGGAGGQRGRAVHLPGALDARSAGSGTPRRARGARLLPALGQAHQRQGAAQALPGTGRHRGRPRAPAGEQAPGTRRKSLTGRASMFQTDRILGFMPVDWRLGVARHPWGGAVLKSRWMPFVPIVVNLFIFTVILMAGYYGGTSPGNYNFGIMIVWIVWWVVLMMVLVPGGSRAWGIGCPLPVLGEWMQRLTLVGVRHNKKGNFYLGLRKRWPKSLSNMWIMNFLFLATTFTTGFITTRPIATFIMLGAIIALAIVLSMVYHKRAFCLYVCPVSGFQGLYSNFAITEVRVKDPAICKGHKN